MRPGTQVRALGTKWQGVPGKDPRLSPPRAVLIKHRTDKAQVLWGPRLCLPLTSKGPQCGLGASIFSQSSHGHLGNTVRLHTEFPNISARLPILFHQDLGHQQSPPHTHNHSFRVIALSHTSCPLSRPGLKKYHLPLPSPLEIGGTVKVCRKSPQGN